MDGRAGAADRLAACVLMPQRDLLLPWRSALDNAGLALELGGASGARPGAGAAELFEPLRARRVRRRAPRRAVGRYAPARRVRAHAARRAARSAAGRAVRVAGRDHARGDPGVDPRSARGRAAHRRCSSRTTSRRRSTSATACWSCRARPGTVRTELAGRPGSGRPAQRGRHVGRVHRAAPARAGGPALRRHARASGRPPLVLLALARGGWETRAPGPDGSRTTCCPRPARSPARWSTTGSCCSRTPGSPPRRCCSVSRSRSRPGVAIAVALHLSGLLRGAPSIHWSSPPRPCPWS